MTDLELKEYLQEHGWKQYINPIPTCLPELDTELWCKTLNESASICTSSLKSPQLCLIITNYIPGITIPDNYTMYIRGEVGGNTCYTLEVYSMQEEDFLARWEDIERRLTIAWNVLHRKPSTN